MKRATMADIAHRAGVSKSTVSHVINGTRFVSAETARRVQQAIEELDYRPSMVARGLASERTGTVGLLISDVGNPFYHQVIRGVEDVALQNDTSVFLFNASYDLDRSLKYIRSMIDRQVDGVMFMSSRLTMQLIDELSRHQVPALILDWEEAQVEGMATIAFDFERGIREAVEHLIGLGHRRFAHVGGPPDLWTARVRQRLFVDALGERGVDPESVLIVEGNLGIDGGREALPAIVQAASRPTAVFAANDLTALGLVWEARKHGVRIPEDLSVVGLDDIEPAGQITPPLTTIALPRYQMGALAMRTLLDLIRAEQSGGVMRHIMPTRLVVRESTGEPPD
jgi:DNA-binding LacI/PurR family transcriptional regulator